MIQKWSLTQPVNLQTPILFDAKNEWQGFKKKKKEKLDEEEKKVSWRSDCLWLEFSQWSFISITTRKADTIHLPECWVLWVRGFLSFHTFSDQIRFDSFEMLHLLQSIPSSGFQLYEQNTFKIQRCKKYRWDILKRLKSVHLFYSRASADYL